MLSLTSSSRVIFDKVSSSHGIKINETDVDLYRSGNLVCCLYGEDASQFRELWEEMQNA